MARFGLTMNVTAPFSVPLAPLTIVIHSSLLLAVHAHVLGVVTWTLKVPPRRPTPWLSGEIVDGHAEGADGGGGGASTAV